MSHHRPDPSQLALTRREFLQQCGMGMGLVGLAGLVGTPVAARAADGFLNPLVPRAPQFPTRARHVIHIFANGGPSHVDTFDRKPALDEWHGREIPVKLRTERKTGAAYKSPFRFRRYGQSGLEISELFEKTAACADDLCVIRSMKADVPNHEPSLLLMNCG